jgi:hypothetical protein
MAFHAYLKDVALLRDDNSTGIIRSPRMHTNLFSRKENWRQDRFRVIQYLSHWVSLWRVSSECDSTWRMIGVEVYHDQSLGDAMWVNWWLRVKIITVQVLSERQDGRSWRWRTREKITTGVEKGSFISCPVFPDQSQDWMMNINPVSLLTSPPLPSKQTAVCSWKFSLPLIPWNPEILFPHTSMTLMPSMVS